MHPGAILDRRFRIEALIGRGGMGTVYRALDLERGCPVAVKLAHEGRDQEGERIGREARALGTHLAGLKHPHIVEYIAHGSSERGQGYVVMEWLEGCDLRTRLRTSALSEADTRAVGLMLCDALAATHDAGVIHRDIKPGNVFLVGGEIAGLKLIDFGLVHLDSSLTALTSSGAILGTPGFIAPEQVTDQACVDERSDLYGVGALLYACLTQRAPFVGVHIIAVLGKLALEEAPSVRAQRADVSPALDALIARLLQKEPRARPASASALAAELAALDADAGGSPARVAGVLGERPGGAVSHGEQQVVTVLLVASMPSCAQALDAAEVAARCAEFGGNPRVLAEGSVLAVFTLEHDPAEVAARAARCALALRAAGARAPMVITTGRGQLRAPAAAVAVGEAIDRATHLLFAPTPGASNSQLATVPLSVEAEVRLDAASAVLLERRFEIEGDAEAGYQLVAESRRPEAARSWGSAGPCVGRVRELRALASLAEECWEERALRVALVSGPIGVGKSRLAHELSARWARDETYRPVIWRASGDPIKTDSALALLRQLLRSALAVPRGASADEARAALLDAVAEVAQRAAARGVAVEPAQVEQAGLFLGEIVGLGVAGDESVALAAARRDARLMHDQMRRAWRRWLDWSAATAPIVLLLDDLQWADRPSVRFLSAAPLNRDERPIFILGLARPEIDTLFPGLWAQHEVERTRLRPLSRRASEELAAALCEPSLLTPARDRLVERAAGNPLFLEQLVKHGAHRAGDRLPETVLALVSLRLGALSPELRRVLRAASVFGRRFWGGAVAALVGDGAAAEGAMAGADSARSLCVLCDEGWVSERPQSRFAGASEYEFRYDLVQEAAYALLPAEDRLRAHREAGRWLERAGERDAWVLAEHYRRGQAPGQARPWYRAAAEHALEASDGPGVLRCAERAIACGADRAEVGLLRRLQAEAHNWNAEYGDGLRCATEAMDKLPVGDAQWALAAHQASWAANSLGDEARVSEIANAVFEWGRADTTPAEVEVSTLVMARSVTHLCMSAPAQALRLLDWLGRRPPSPQPSVRATMLHAHGFVAGLLGDYGVAADYFGQASAAWRAIGDERQLCLEQTNLGVCLRELGCYEDCVAVMRASVAAAERLGVEHLNAGFRVEIAVALARQGRHREVAQGMAQVMTGATYRRGFEEGYVALIRLLSGDAEGALAHLDEAAQAWREPEPGWGLRAAVRGRALLETGRRAEAREVCARAIEQLEALVLVEEGEVLLRLTHAEALWADGARAEAAAAIAEAAAIVRARAARIANPEWRQCYLTAVWEHREVLARAQAWAGA